jgi:hypothetical protein
VTRVAAKALALVSVDLDVVLGVVGDGDVSNFGWFEPLPFVHAHAHQDEDEHEDEYEDEWIRDACWSAPRKLGTAPRR